MRSFRAVAGVVLTVLTAVPQVVWSGAAESESVRLRELEDTVRMLRQEVEELKKEREELKTLREERKELAVKTPPPKEAPKFPINVGASITFRYDVIDVEDQTDVLLDDNTTEGLRTRDRLWARFEPDGPVNAGVRLTTGGDPNPTVPFIRLGDLFRSKSFRLDQFYIIVHPIQLFDERPRAELPLDVSLHVGKFPQPLWLGQWGTWTDELIWDQDVQPEGVVLKLASPELTPFFGIEGTGGYFALQEVDDFRFNGLTGDAFLLAGQLLLQAQPAALAFTYYDYENLNAGLRSPSFVPGSGAFLTPGDAAFLLRPGVQRTNNQLDFGPGAIGFTQDDFQVINLTGQLHFPIPAVPEVAPEIFFVGDWTHNLSVDNDQNAYGLTLGLRGGGQQGSRLNPFHVWFTYRDVDADATLATFADSDLGAGTAYRGFEAAVNYRIHRHLLFQFSGFKFEGFPGKENDVTRFLFDLIAEF